MSVLGTGVAAGVAQTGLQAQQAARQRDKVNERTARDDKRVRELAEDHLLTLTEEDDVGGPDQLLIDAQLPRFQTPQNQDSRPNKAAPDGSDEQTEPGSKEDGELYRHLDMKA